MKPIQCLAELCPAWSSSEDGVEMGMVRWSLPCAATLSSSMEVSTLVMELV